MATPIPDFPIPGSDPQLHSSIRLRVLSLGAGVQSSTLALMAAHGEIGPMPDCAIFSDTGWEPAAVYQHLAWLRSSNVLPFPVHVISAGDIRTDLLRASSGARWASIPAFTRTVKRGCVEVGMIRRQCTKDYKIVPIRRKVRELVGLTRRKSPDAPIVEQWIGISLDEVIRSRSRRHVVLTSALALALGLGLLAMIRGAARARELAQLKSDFVSTVSHELKTPLTSIRMFAEMLEQGVAKGDPAKMQRYHGVIVQESQRLGLLIGNLLDYAQIEKGTRRYAPTRESAAALARHAVATFESLRAPDAPRNPIVVDVSSDAMVMVDRDVVVGALLNLLANAAKYGGADKPIEVRIADEAISVTDHGPGIPAHEQARIFREFYRAPEAYRSGVEGTGLGLALVKRHIEALGGSVDVASSVGEGATFTIRLPRSEAA